MALGGYKWQCRIIGENAVVKKVGLRQLVNRVVFHGWKCLRYDIPIKHLAIRHYLKSGELDPMYVREQMIRNKLSTQRPKPVFNEKIFMCLIEDFRQNKQYDPERPILYDRKNNLCDGAHRLAVCMYFDIKPIYAARVEEGFGADDYRFYIQVLDPEDIVKINCETERLRRQWTT